MSVSIRAVLMPGVALAAVGAVALAPTLVAPTASPVQPHVAVPAVYIADVQLAGIGRDIYNSASAVVQGLVMGGATTGLMALTEKKNETHTSVIPSFVPGISDTTFVSFGKVDL